MISLREKVYIHTKKTKMLPKPQALLALAEQMSEAISSGKYGVVVMADLEAAFDAVWRDGVVRNNTTTCSLLSIVFFVTNYQ